MLAFRARARLVPEPRILSWQRAHKIPKLSGKHELEILCKLGNYRKFVAYIHLQVLPFFHKGPNAYIAENRFLGSN